MRENQDVAPDIAAYLAEHGLWADGMEPSEAARAAAASMEEEAVEYIERCYREFVDGALSAADAVEKMRADSSIQPFEIEEADDDDGSRVLRAVRTRRR